MDIYSDFVRDVDPRGYITDLLFQRRVINDEILEQLRRKETRQECCRSMLRELGSGGNPEAFVVLRTALQKEYSYIVKKIDETISGRPIWSTFTFALKEVALISCWVDFSQISANDKYQQILSVGAPKVRVTNS